MNSAGRRSHAGNEAAIVWRGAASAAGGDGRAAGFERAEQETGALIAREAAAAWAACGAFEWVALGYLAAVSALIAVFAENLEHPLKLIGVQILVAAMILAVCGVEARAAERAEWRVDTFSAKFWHFWRHW